MKKIVFLLSFFLVAGVSLNAQSAKKECAKKCSKAKTASATADAETTTAVAAAYMEADEAAESNENVEKRVCSKSGSVSYFEKSVCSKSGKVSHNEVEYDTEAKKFVNVSPTKVMSSEMEASATNVSTGDKKACDANCTKACCSAAAKKACKKTCKKTCSKGKAKTGA